MSTAEGMKYILRMLNWAVVPDERVVFLYGLYQVPASRAEVKQFALASNAIVLLPALRLLGAQPPIPRNAEQALRL